ncbi:PilN domain-containing protein [Cellulomonas iranensis]|uniref:PilN domain-containing protein n=1 Tax=Cellulomonas iranensis TaxID=76862 RepID=UPI0013D7D602|nr:PilN domain-containing protein [Cellulomonas iranensis]
MSAQTLRAPARQKKGAAVFTPGLPQVNLLPPEVRAARSLAVVKRWLVVALLVTVAVVGLAYVSAVFVRSAAESRLADAESQTVALRAEERKYAEVPQVRGAIDQVTAARQAATATEIQWLPYLDAVSAVLPDDVRIESFAATGPAPTGPAQQPTGPLDAASIASFSFQGQSTTVPDTAAMLDGLASVPGMHDPWVSSIAVTEVEGVTFYTFSATVQMGPTTLAQRFAPTTEEN